MITLRRLFLRDLLGLFGLLAALSVGLAVWGVHQALEQQISARSEEHLARVQQELDRHLREAEHLGQAVARAWSDGLLPFQDMDRLAAAEPSMRLLLEAVPGVSTLTVLDARGRGLILSRTSTWDRSILALQGTPCIAGRILREKGRRVDRPYAPQGVYDPTERPWFRSAQSRPDGHWVPMYVFNDAVRQGLSYVIPLRGEDGSFRGLVCVDQLLDELSEGIARARPTRGTRTLVCDSQGRALVVPPGTPAPPARPSPFLLPVGHDFLPDFSALLQAWMQKDQPERLISLRWAGEGWSGRVRRTRSAGGQTWQLLTLLPDREYRAPARRLAVLLSGLGVAFLALFAWRAGSLSRRLARPLAALARAAEQFGKGPGELPRSALLKAALEGARPVKEVQTLGSTLLRAAEALEAEEEMQLKLEHGQRLQTVGTLAGGIAHDVNNQLAAIVGQLNLGREMLEPDHPARRRIGRAEEAAERCSQMVRTLLGFSHKARPQLRPLDLNEVVQRTALLLERILGGLVRLELDLEPGVLPVRGEPVQLEQVILNLAVNARDAMPEGGRLCLRTRRTAGSQARLSVSDTGCGIPKSHLERIFEPFFTTKEVGKGNGLGLAMVFSIVQAHGGTVEVDSEPGEGTTFHIGLSTLAEANRDLPDAPVPAAPAPAALAGRRILVAEDDAHLRELYAELFTEARAQVDTAADGAVAWTLFSQGRYDLVLSDQRMPELTGLELLGRIRATGCQVGVILASGYGLEGREAELERDPRVRFLPKPFRVEVLLEAAAALLPTSGS